MVIVVKAIRRRIHLSGLKNRFLDAMDEEVYFESLLDEAVSQDVVDMTMRIEQKLYAQFVSVYKILQLDVFAFIRTSRIYNDALLCFVEQYESILLKRIKNKRLYLQHERYFVSKIGGFFPSPQLFVSFLGP